jgi:hypothetical protein
MTMNWILLNIPLGILMVAFTVGLPLWVMLKFPEGDDKPAVQTATPRPREHTALAARSIHQHSTTGELYPSTSY